MNRTIANGQPAAVASLHAQPFGVAALDSPRDGIAAITAFSDPALIARFTT